MDEPVKTEPVKMAVADQRMLDNMSKVNVLAHEIGSLDQLIAIANAVKAMVYQKHQEELRQWKMEQKKAGGPMKKAGRYSSVEEEDDDIEEEDDN